jgi:hypothetical protein
VARPGYEALLCCTSLRGECCGDEAETRDDAMATMDEILRPYCGKISARSDADLSARIEFHLRRTQRLFSSTGQLSIAHACMTDTRARAHTARTHRASSPH